MPGSSAGLLILVLAMFPGFAGEFAYALLIGRDWREREVERILRILGFSIFGLIGYVLSAAPLHLPSADQVIPASYAPGMLRATSLVGLAEPFLGHVVMAVIAGVLFGLLVRCIAAIRHTFSEPSTWDYFVKQLVPNRWITVATASGESYAGKLVHCDVNVGATERDIVLSEPAKFDPDRNRYRTISNQFLYLPAQDVHAIGVVYDPAIDQSRTVPIETDLFEEERND